MRCVAITFTLGLTLACNGSEKASPPSAEAKTETPKPPEPGTVEQPEEPASLPAKDGFFMAEGAPEPRGCTVAGDCLGDTIPDVDNPCCQNPTTLEPHAHAYRTWIADWRRDHCADVTCPPPPAPSQPPDCAFAVDCVDGVCVDSCP